MAISKSSNLEQRLIEFCVLLAELIPELPQTRIGNYIADHLVRSGFFTLFQLRGSPGRGIKARFHPQA